jgi:hypothetical protein
MNQAGSHEFGGGFWSVPDAAAITKRSPWAIWRAIRSGRIPAYGTRGCIRVRLADVMPPYRQTSGYTKSNQDAGISGTESTSPRPAQIPPGPRPC